jgi:hypothetical protein
MIDYFHFRDGKLSRRGRDYFCPALFGQRMRIASTPDFEGINFAIAALSSSFLVVYIAVTSSQKHVIFRAGPSSLFKFKPSTSASCWRGRKRSLGQTPAEGEYEGIYCGRSNGYDMLLVSLANVGPAVSVLDKAKPESELSPESAITYSVA